MFIDDRNLGGLPDWGTIYRMIKEEKSYMDIVREELTDTEDYYEQPKKKRWWKIGK